MSYLVLSNGAVFEGRRIGANGDSIGELVFTTGVVGYLETLTDPSYAGQIVMQTFPLIGNYGVIEEDFEGVCAVKGYVVRELCDTPSNFRAEYALDRFLKDRGVPGICGVDTRQLTRIIREEGVMNAIICDEIPADLGAVQSYRVQGVVPAVSCKAPQFYPATAPKKYNITLIDYGEKRGILRALRARGCDVTVVPHDTTAQNSGVWHLPRSSAHGARHGRRYGQAPLRPPRRQPAGQRPVRHTHLYHKPEPRLCGCCRIARRQGRCQLHQRQRRLCGGCAVPRTQVFHRAVPPRSVRRAD